MILKRVLFCLIMLPASLSWPTTAVAETRTVAGKTTPRDSLSWADRRFYEIDHALSRLELNQGVNPDPIYYSSPLTEIQKAQTACETLQGEIRMRGRSVRLPGVVKYSPAVREAVLNLCIHIARHKTMMESGNESPGHDLFRLTREARRTRELVHVCYVLHTSSSRGWRVTAD